MYRVPCRSFLDASAGSARRTKGESRSQRRGEVEGSKQSLDLGRHLGPCHQGFALSPGNSQLWPPRPPERLSPCLLLHPGPGTGPRRDFSLADLPAQPGLRPGTSDVRQVASDYRGPSRGCARYPESISIQAGAVAYLDHLEEWEMGPRWLSCDDARLAEDFGT